MGNCILKKPDIDMSHPDWDCLDLLDEELYRFDFHMKESTDGSDAKRMPRSVVLRRGLRFKFDDTTPHIHLAGRTATLLEFEDFEEYIILEFDDKSRYNYVAVKVRGHNYSWVEDDSEPPMLEGGMIEKDDVKSPPSVSIASSISSDGVNDDQLHRLSFSRSDSVNDEIYISVIQCSRA